MNKELGYLYPARFDTFTQICEPLLAKFVFEEPRRVVGSIAAILFRVIENSGGLEHSQNLRQVVEVANEIWFVFVMTTETLIVLIARFLCVTD